MYKTLKWNHFSVDPLLCVMEKVVIVVVETFTMDSERSIQLFISAEFGCNIEEKCWKQ